jgi:hypothetical protein
MFLPWNNISVTPDQVAINRGIQIAIGTPPQIFSMRPSTADVDLYVANKADCAPSYNDSCESFYGGVFDPNASSTFHLTTKGHWNGTDDPSLTGLASIYFNDVLFFGNATSYGFPLFLDQPGYGMSYVRFFVSTSLGWLTGFIRWPRYSSSRLELGFPKSCRFIGCSAFSSLRPLDRKSVHQPSRGWLACPWRLRQHKIRQ